MSHAVLRGRSTHGRERFVALVKLNAGLLPVLPAASVTPTLPDAQGSKAYQQRQTHDKSKKKEEEACTHLATAAAEHI